MPEEYLKLRQERHLPSRVMTMPPSAAKIPLGSILYRDAAPTALSFRFIPALLFAAAAQAASDTDVTIIKAETAIENRLPGQFVAKIGCSARLGVTIWRETSRPTIAVPTSRYARCNSSRKS